MKPLSDEQLEINRNLKILYPEALALSAQEFQDEKYKEIINKLPKTMSPYFQEYNERFLKLALRHIDRKLIEEINKELLEYFPDARPIADIEFVINKDVKKIIKTLDKFDGNYQLLESIYKVIAKRPPFERLVEYCPISRTVRDLFEFDGNSNKALIDQLIDIEYLSTVISPYMESWIMADEAADEYEREQNESIGLYERERGGAYSSYNHPIFVCIDSWIEYCEFVDNTIEFINNKFPNWNKMKKSEKNEYIKQLKLFQELEFLGPHEKLDRYIDFLETQTLHKNGLKAKSTFLLNLNLPRIDTLEIATQVTKNSNFIKNHKF